jgi:hypothetical protein
MLFPSVGSIENDLKMNHAAAAIRIECGSQHTVMGGCLLWRGTTEGLAHIRSIHKLIAKGRPHLQYRVGKTKFKISAGDGWVGRGVTQVAHLPGLRLPAAIGQGAQCARIFG